MANIIISPSKYVQGPGELDRLGAYAAGLGKKAMVLCSAHGLTRTRKRLEGSFAAAGMDLDFQAFQGECSQTEVDRLSALMEQRGCDVVVGVGGGKTLDTAKAVAYFKRTPVAVVPTIASTDAPCSALSVLYTDDGVFERYLFLPKNPDLVLVDSEVVSKAPARLLVSGMGDALATYFEAQAAADSRSSTCAGGGVTKAALALAKLCYDTLMEDGLKARLAVERQCCTPAVEHIIEANTYLSGIGFESGGLAGAHAIHNGFTVLPACHHLYHGEKVAFGTIVQLVLQNADNETLDEVIRFCLDLGLPVTLSGMGISSITEEQLMRVADAATAEGESIYNMPMEITPGKVRDAILAADALGRYYQG